MKKVGKTFVLVAGLSFVLLLVLVYVDRNTRLRVSGTLNHIHRLISVKQNKDPPPLPFYKKDSTLTRYNKLKELEKTFRNHTETKLLIPVSDFVSSTLTNLKPTVKSTNLKVQKSTISTPKPPSSTRNPLQINLDQIEVIRQDCGELCNTSRPGFPGPYFNHTRAKINCTSLFRNEYIDRGHGLPHAPREIPKNLLKDYLQNKRISISKFYFDQKYLGKKALTPVWTNETVEKMISLAKQGKLPGTYGHGETNALRDGLQHAPGIKDGRVLVIGSENPWVEACALEAGAREVITLEYGSIKSEHPRIKTMIPSEFRMMYLNNTLGTFDAIVTFSSVEHSGLGRYGDALNPWGDIIAIARAWCVTKLGGSLTIGVMYNYEHDNIRFNADRNYGKVRYPYLTTNWKQLYRGKGIQKVHVFTKDS